MILNWRMGGAKPQSNSNISYQPDPFRELLADRLFSLSSNPTGFSVPHCGLLQNTLITIFLLTPFLNTEFIFLLKGLCYITYKRQIKTELRVNVAEFCNSDKTKLWHAKPWLIFTAQQINLKILRSPNYHHSAAVKCCSTETYSAITSCSQVSSPQGEDVCL